MLYANASSFPPVQFTDELPVTLRVTLVVSACIGSALGNVALLFIFAVSLKSNESNRNNMKNRSRVIDIIIASLAVVALCRTLVLGPVRTACFIIGEWPLGDTVCQIQAYLEAMLRNVFLWYLSLLSIERYTNHIISYEYLMTFTPLSMHVFLPGILLIVIVQATGPLYGWGQYVYIRDTGLCGAAITSTFGCSYALYILFSFMLPPVFVILINGVLLSSFACKKPRTTENLTCGISRILNEENEIITLIVFMILFIALSAPRCIADTTIMCKWVSSWKSSVTFIVYFLESITDLLLPILCLGMHPKSRKLLYEGFTKSDIEECEQQEMFSIQMTNCEN